MNPIWKQFLVKAVPLLGLCWFLGYLGFATAGWLLAVLALSWWLLRWVTAAARVWNWSADFAVSKVPHVDGWWEDLVARIYRLQKERQQQLERQTNEAAELRHMIQALPEGVLTLDQDNHILWCDPTAAHHLALDPGRDLGLSIINLVRHPDFVNYIRAHREGRQPDAMVKIPGPFPGAILSVQLLDYGRAQRLLLTRDISQWEKLDIMRRDFIANVSHELKTPLTVIAGFLETLSEHTLPVEQQAHFLALMSEQSQRMQGLVEDLLTLSSLESGGDQASEDQVAMDQLLAQVERDACSLSQGRHTMNFTFERGLNLRGNEQELLSALGNLVSNAIRYTPDGGAIHVRWARQQGTQGASFSVQDSGIGIEAQHIPRLTERFYRVDRSRSRESGGTGLGLAIVKHVLMRHQARLEVKSTLGKGSTFSAEFPAHRTVAADGDGQA
ncbi:MAG: phosphate regulon sensor histidine kinase PhoR [Burkholderiaceae bacterium]|nr:MAG: phosphate regulon sensor histidine kinase PhoR [Burkholderiaceae bacterium]